MRAPTLVGRPSRQDGKHQRRYSKNSQSRGKLVRTGVESEDNHPVNHVVGPLEPGPVRRKTEKIDKTERDRHVGHGGHDVN